MVSLEKDIKLGQLCNVQMDININKLPMSRTYDNYLAYKGIDDFT